MLFVVGNSGGVDIERAQSDRGQFDSICCVSTNDLSKSAIGMDQQITLHELTSKTLKLPTI